MLLRTCFANVCSTPGRRSKRLHAPTVVSHLTTQTVRAIGVYQRHFARAAPVPMHSTSRSTHPHFGTPASSFGMLSRRDGRSRSIAPVSRGHRPSISRVVSRSPSTCRTADSRHVAGDDPATNHRRRHRCLSPVSGPPYSVLTPIPPRTSACMCRCSSVRIAKEIDPPGALSTRLELMATSRATRLCGRTRLTSDYGAAIIQMYI